MPIKFHATLRNMSFGSKLAAIRKEKHLSQSEVGKAIDVEKSRISNWENGKGNPSLENLMALCKVLGISIDYLVFDNVPREGVESINDFALYEYFRKTEILPEGEKETIKKVIDAVVFKYKVKEIPEADVPKPARHAEAKTLRKVAGKR